MGLLSRRTSDASPSQKIEKDVPIINRLGLHARPAAMFVRIPDAAKAMAELEELISARFHED